MERLRCRFSEARSKVTTSIGQSLITMLNQGNVIPCAISTAAMDNIEGKHNVRPDQRVDQFMRLREVIEERESRKFFEEKAQGNQPLVLRANDFSK